MGSSLHDFCEHKAYLRGAALPHVLHSGSSDVHRGAKSSSAESAADFPISESKSSARSTHDDYPCCENRTLAGGRTDRNGVHCLIARRTLGRTGLDFPVGVPHVVERGCPYSGNGCHYRISRTRPLHTSFRSEHRRNPKASSHEQDRDRETCRHMPVFCIPERLRRRHLGRSSWC